MTSMVGLEAVVVRLIVLASDNHAPGLESVFKTQQLN